MDNSNNDFREDEEVYDVDPRNGESPSSSEPISEDEESPVAEEESDVDHSSDVEHLTFISLGIRSMHEQSTMRVYRFYGHRRDNCHPNAYSEVQRYHLAKLEARHHCRNPKEGILETSVPSSA